MWRLADQAAALAVGPNQGDGSWWSNTAGDVTTRACLFDDSISFDAMGNMVHYMDGNTWLEVWQGVAQDECGSPVAPHDGTTNAPYTYVYDSGAGTLTVNGIGAHIGLPKAVNGGQLSNPVDAPASVTYQVSFVNANNTMIADINYGTGWWRFVYERTNSVNLPDPNVTFRVDMSEYTGTIGTAVYLNGSFNNWCGDCAPMNNIGGGIWELTVPLPVGAVQYLFTVDGWTDLEAFALTDACVDPIDDGFNNRYYEVTADATLPVVCFGSCVACLTNGIDEITSDKLSVFPNPSTDQITIRSEKKVQSIEVIDLNGNVLKTIKAFDSQAVLNVSDLINGFYFIKCYTEDEILRRAFIKD
jgi:hypothetical protein